MQTHTADKDKASERASHDRLTRLAFGKPLPRWGRNTRLTELERGVLARWAEYFTHLRTPRPAEPAARSAWDTRATELFINLLEAIAKERRVPISREALSVGAYYPTGPIEREMERDRLRNSGMVVVELMREALLAARSHPTPSAKTNSATPPADATRGATSSRPGRSFGRVSRRGPGARRAVADQRARPAAAARASGRGSAAQQ